MPYPHIKRGAAVDPRTFTAMTEVGETAYLWRSAHALREGGEGVRLMPPEKEAWRGNWRVFQLARIEAMVGETETAIDHLEYLLSISFDLTVAELRIDPAWDPLRGDQRFEALIEH